MLYEQYTIGGELMHSAKGVEWKNKKYIDKVKTKNGKWRYIYKNQNTKENYEKMLNKHGIATKKKKQNRATKIINKLKRSNDLSNRLYDESNKLINDEWKKAQKEHDNFRKNMGNFDDDIFEISKESDRDYNLDRRKELVAHLEKEQRANDDSLLETIYPMLAKIIEKLDKRFK